MSTQQTKTDLMQAVVAQNLNSIPAADSITPRGFIENASNWLGGWWRLKEKWKTVTPGYCALVFDPDFSARPEVAEYEFVKLFRYAKSSDLGGAIYVTDYSLNKVYRKRGEFKDANAIINQLELDGLTAAPTVLFEPEVGVLILAEGGASNQIVQIELTTFDGQLTVENVSELLDDIYDSTFKYPETFPHVWFNKEKLIPIFEAEKLYQNLAFTFLRAVTQNTWVVVRENQNNAGRTDLSLFTLNPRVTYVLEIKVLKSFHYNRNLNLQRCKDEENESWANSGIDQVIDYRTAQNAEEAFLLLYDMRKTNADIDSVVKRCGEESVVHRRYYIHNATARDTRASAKSE